MFKRIKRALTKNNANRYKPDGSVADPEFLINRMNDNLEKVAKDAIVLFGDRAMACHEIQRELIITQGWMSFGLQQLQQIGRQSSPQPTHPAPEAEANEEKGTNVVDFQQKPEQGA